MQQFLLPWMLIALVNLTACSLFDLSLGDNQLVNGNFSLPVVSSYSFLTSIPGWSCTTFCELCNCSMVRDLYARGGLISVDCGEQVIDLDSNGLLETVSQIVELKAGEHQLEFDYYFPFKSANSKRLFVHLND